MKKYAFISLMFTLLVTSLACQTLTRGLETEPGQSSPGDATEEPSFVLPTDEGGGDSGFSFGGESEFPMPDDASDVTEIAGTVNFQTSLSLDDALKFYRDYYTSNGYTERELLTTVTDDVFSIVFDGDPSGQAVVIQAVDLGNGTTNINISLQDV